MFDKEEAKAKLKELIENFSNASKNKDFIDGQNEEYIKWNFIEPLFEILGWHRADIEKESRILKGRADYILKIGNQEVLIVEAKKTNVRLSEEEGRQAVSYAYHRKIKFAVLTNFKEIRVYHALSNIKNIDANLLKFEAGGYFRLTFEQFLDNFDKLLLLSKESFEKEEISKLLSKKDERASKPIDESILADLLEIREWLSKDLKKLRMHLTKEQIDEAVQVLIDRLIFMRSVEDRGLEGKNFLLGLVKDFREGRVQKQLWYILKEEFRRFDKVYNSKLFDASILEDEKNIFFDNDSLQNSIKALYYGSRGQQERYMFDEIPGDLLGNIYEQYLGTILQGTDKRVKLEEKSGKRKKMGIYYTPSYIVDYIVKNTVGEYIKDKSIDEILEVNIVDPACGSGSFLIRAFQELCSAVEQRLKAGEKSKIATFQYFKDKLSLGQKATIMSNCIYGVDLDEKAVELAQLNLLLKILEEETPDTHKRLLPNLRDNIKNGNSLIDDPNVAGDKAFNWNAQFPDVFRNGGFDVVIGNPPYVLMQQNNTDNKLLEYFKNNFLVAQYKIDTYHLFFEKSLKIANEKGRIGFITPNTYFMNVHLNRLREYILEQCSIVCLVVIPEEVFPDASVDTAIVILEKEKDKNLRYQNQIDIYKLRGNRTFFQESLILQGKILDSTEKFFNISSNEGNIKFNSKFYGVNFVKLREIAHPYFGIQTFDRKKYVSVTSLSKSYKPVIDGQDIGRYFLSNRREFVKFEPASIKSGGKSKVYENEKIFIRQIGKVPIATYGPPSLYSLNTVFNLYIKDKEFNIKYLLALLNSKLIGYFWKLNFSDSKELFPKIKRAYLEEIPVYMAIEKEQRRIVIFVDKMLSLQKKLHEGNLSGNEKERLVQQVQNTDYEIDQEVYKLYGITKEEQKIIEESLG